MQSAIRQLLANVGGLGARALELNADADLYDAGLKSLAAVRLVVALEQELAVEFSSDMLGRDTFSSIAAIERAIVRLRAQPRGNA